MKRRSLLKVLSLGGLLGQTAARAEEFPKAGKSIRVLVGFAAGGPTDLQARSIGLELSKVLGTAVIVENKPGASGALAAVEVARAEADGHTLLYTVDGPLTQTPHLLKHLPYDAFRDYKPVIRSAVGGVVLVVHPSIGVNNVKELIAYGRANHGKLSYGSFGAGTVSHIYGAVLAQKTGIDMVHIPYKGSSDAMRDLIAGRVQIMFDAPSVVSQYARDGRLKLLGATGATRRSTMPEVPTLLEQGLVGFELRSWNGFFAPAAIRPDALQRLHDAIRMAQQTSSVAEVYRNLGFEVPEESQKQFADLVHRDYEAWGKYFDALAIKIE
ncbi:Bug family tripartite tricarboxylate transporter substrate binding protein [Variovorax sp. RT4R15]|uniref:Bug family tripartite tricarboxylate transporter substrate binding protein n=1 Tax=Variovorax sp. RT4R15 TaxID=3443737 RepID=UPI003F44E2EA